MFELHISPLKSKGEISNFSFTNRVQSYYNVLFDMLKPYIYQNGGPILMIQLDNEYAALKACDHTYIEFLRDLIWSKVGNDVVLYTSKSYMATTTIKNSS